MIRLIFILQLQVWFAPGLEPQKEIIHEIDSAKVSIDVQAYNFTASEIGDALIAAEHRGVKVRIIQDHMAFDQKNNQLQRCKAAGADCWLDTNHPIAHNKVMIFDKSIVLTGSYNFSHNATKNGENLIKITDKTLVKSYSDNWEKHKAEINTMELK